MDEVYIDMNEFIKNSFVCHRCGKRQDKQYMEYCCQLKTYFCKEFFSIKSCHDLYHQ